MATRHVTRVFIVIIAFYVHGMQLSNLLRSEWSQPRQNESHHSNSVTMNSGDVRLHYEYYFVKTIYIDSIILPTVDLF